MKVGHNACVSSKIEMAETEELKQMVLSFRRSELVDLLGFVGMNKVGVKATLLQRAVTLINSSRGCSVPVQIKIRDLYRQIHNPYATDPPRSRQVPSRTQTVADLRTRRYPPGKTVSPGHSSTGAVDFSQRGADAAALATSSVPVHPDVTFKRLPFYDIIGELLKPTSLVPKGPSRYQETYFVFHLTPQQAQDIAMSRDFRPTAKCEYSVQVQLRFCFLETSCEQDDNFPPSICVRVNGKMAQLPNPIPTTKPGVEPKRPGRPVDITSLCRISPTMPNHVEISWASEYQRGFCVSINLVKRLTADVLLQRLKQFGNRHADFTRALIKEKLHHDPDSEIATTSLRISLNCPLGMMRMQLPCRAGTCTHLQCFDATTFLMMNEKKATWMCPVCDRNAPFHKLVIDGLFVEILRKVRDVDEIQFIADGSWSPIYKNKECHMISSPSTSKITVNLDGGNSDSYSSSSADKTVNLCGDSSSDTSTSSPAKRPKLDQVIDLTLSSDSEDESEPARPLSRHDISSGSSTPSLIVNPTVVSPGKTVSRSPMAKAPSPAHLPPMPPLLNYTNGSATATASPIKTSPDSRPVPPSGGMFKYEGQYPMSGSLTTARSFSPSDTGPSTPSWLTALSGQTQGQKRPPPAHTNNQPPLKRPLLEKLSESPSSSNSNMSPLVDLDQLCSILDSDRDRHSEEITNVLFPADFPMSGAPSTSRTSSSSGAAARGVFNVSPSDVISLD